MTDQAPAASSRVDAHHHVWDLDVRPQGWTDALPQIARTFGIEELLPQLDEGGVTGTILVETIGVPEETGELLALAEQHAQVRGVVGWVDLAAADVADRLAELQALPGGDRLVGVRHQVQGEADPRWLTRSEVLDGLAAVARAGLVFELLVTPHQLPAAVDAVRATPAGTFVLAHLGKPPVASGDTEPWARHVAALAAEPNVAAKLSGLVTEASEGWTVEELRPYVAHALATFGPDRLMAGSDWPVCLLRASWGTVWRTHEDLLAHLSDAERDAVLGGAAQRWYSL